MTSEDAAATPDPAHRNEVQLVGRLAADPVERTLPSGDVLVTWRLVVRRPAHSRRGPPVDTIDCVAWVTRLRRSATRWSAGDIIECAGALRRRFWRTAGGAVSRCEVEVSRARRRRETRLEATPTS